MTQPTYAHLEQAFTPMRSTRYRPRPNVLLILADDVGRADLGAYGRTDVSTPNLDRLALGGIRFTEAYAAAHDAETTRAALLSGHHPGPYGEGPQLAAALSATGYTTRSYVIDDPATSNAAAALRGLAHRRGDDPWLFSLEMPATTRSRTHHLTSIDDLVGDCVRALRREGRLRSTIILFAGARSDNTGAGAGEQRVPTMLSWPQELKPRQVDTMPVYTVDWAATLLALTRTRTEARLDGFDLTDHLLRTGARVERDTFWLARHDRALRATRAVRLESSQPRDHGAVLVPGEGAHPRGQERTGIR